jgi:hypothetical protein
MNKVIASLLLLTIHFAHAQVKIDLRSNFEFIKHDPIVEKEPYPNFLDTLILKPTWTFNITSDASVQKIIPPIVYKGLVFTYYSKDFAIDIKTGRKVSFGSETMRSLCVEGDYIAFSDSDSTYLTSLFFGKKIAKFGNDGISRINIVADTVFYSYQKQGVFAYSIPKKKILWSWKENYTSFSKIVPFENGLFVTRVFYDFRKDSLVNSLLYLSKGAIKKRIDFLVEEPKEIIINENELFVYNDSEVHSVDVKSWSLKWSRRGDISQRFVIVKNELISPAFKLDRKTGKLIYTSRVGWLSNIVQWKNGIILDIQVDDASRKFITDSTFNKTYKIIFREEYFGPCKTEDISDSGIFSFMSNSKDNLTVAIGACENGLYLYGFKLNSKIDY